MPRTRATIRERELSRRVRLARGQVGQQGCGGALGGRHERVLRDAPPGGEAEHGVVRRGAPQVREGLDGVREEHHAEARGDPVEALRLERVHLCVGADEARGRQLACGPGPGGGDHRLGDVDADAGGFRSQQAGERERRAAGAAADVQHSASRSGGSPFQQEVLERREHPVERFLRVDPGVPGRAVPQRGLWSSIGRVVSMLSSCLRAPAGTMCNFKWT
jgi:hypothetical protein